MPPRASAAVAAAAEYSIYVALLQPLSVGSHPLSQTCWRRHISSPIDWGRSPVIVWPASLNHNYEDKHGICHNKIQKIWCIIPQIKLEQTITTIIRINDVTVITTSSGVVLQNTTILLLYILYTVYIFYGFTVYLYIYLLLLNTHLHLLQSCLHLVNSLLYTCLQHIYIILFYVSLMYILSVYFTFCTFYVLDFKFSYLCDFNFIHI